MAKTTKATLSLPRLIVVDDYHQFDYFKGLINDLHPRPKIKVKEVGSGGGYVGVVYVGRLPDKRTIQRLFLEQGLEREPT